jgi:DNA-binding LacI/PurR family transcriptional regulator
MEKKATLKQIAEIAGVSLATVSRVARRSGVVSSEVQERVRRAASQLGTSLGRSNRPLAVTFILSNRTKLHYFHSRVLVGVEAYLAEHGCVLQFASLNYSPNLPLQKIQAAHLLDRVDPANGYIVAGTNSRNLLELFAKEKVPFSVLGNNVIGPWTEELYDTVWFDDIQGSHELVRFLQSQGHKDIWFVGNRRFPWYERCYRGYSRAMAEKGLEARISEYDAEDERQVGLLVPCNILSFAY